MLLFILLAAFLLLVLLYRKWCQVREYWAVRGVPYTPPHPIFGSLGFLLSQNMILYMKSEFERHKPTPYYGMWIFWRPVLVVCDPDLAKNILIKDFDVFRDRFPTGATFDTIGHLNIFTVKDPLWTSVRRRLTMVFTSAKLRSLQPLKLRKCKELVQRIRNLNAENKRIHLRDLYANFTTDVISTAAFGIEGDATLTGQSPMRKVTRGFNVYSIKNAIGVIAIFFLPEMHRFVRIPLLPKPATDYFRRVFKEVVKQRESWKKDHEIRDLLDVLLNMKREANALGEEMSDDMVVAQASVLLQAGFDTSAVALTFATYEMAYNPDIQRKLYNEVYEAKQQLGDNDFDSQTLVGLTYLHSLIKETLRKYPAMGWLDRVSARNYKVDEKLTIPAGMPVYVNSAAIQYNTEYYSNPDTFDPERFMPENEGNIRPFTFLPFGEGPRSCIGLRLGRQVMAYALAHLILNFELKPLPDFPIPSKIRMEPKSISLGPAYPLSIEFVPRFCK